MVVGVIGLGGFGRFAASVLARDKGLEVIAYDAHKTAAPDGVRKVSQEEVAQADIVVLCVPLAAYGVVLPRLKPLLRENTLVIDICSVKVEANRRLRRHLPDHPNLLITHPMFGPQSAANGTAGHVLVVTDSVGKKAEVVIRYCDAKLGLKIMRMTTEEHDRAMADVHALTFFVARGLANAGLTESAFQAPSFQMLLDLVAFDKAHSEDLFRTIELGNPFAKQARARLMTAFKEVDDKLGKETL